MERFFSERGLGVFRGPAIVFNPYHSKKSIFFEILLMHARKKFSKIDFFRFFQKCAKSCLGIKYGLETGFKHFGGDFDAIFDDLHII